MFLSRKTVWLVALIVLHATVSPGASRAQSAAGSGSASILLTGVNVVPMDAERVLADHAVLLLDGAIAWVGPASAAPPAADARVIEGDGAWVVPGLVDMHVHVRDPDELDLYLLNGVTTVANLSGTPEHLELRERIRAGDLRGPTIYTTGPTIDGDPPRNSRFLAFGDPAEAEAVIADLVEAGYDFVKIYDLIENPAYAALTDAAQAADRAVVGHIPKAIGLEGILGRHDMVAHGEEYFYTFFGNEADRSRLAEAARLTAEAGLAVIPNTGMIRSIIAQAEDLDRVLERPGIRYLPPSTLTGWLPEGNRYLGRGDAWLARNKVMYPFLVELTGALHEAGVVLVAGSDASVAGAEPGFSLHREIGELVEAGLTRYEALRAATASAGDWIGAHLHEPIPPGIVAPSRRADLLVLDRNPLEDLGALQEIRAVVVRGRWIDHARIEADVERRAAGYAEALRPYERFRELVRAGRFAEAEALLAEAPDLLSESALNGMGYYWLGVRQDPATAIGVFAMNARAHPASSNVWDSLGEAYMEAGQRELAIENYRKSLELDPGNENAVEMLEELGAPVGS